MKFVIVYGTTEGQTRRIARFCADRLADAGHAVELLPAAEAGDLELSRFDGAVLAGSLHIGAFQKELAAFATARAAALRAMPTLFLAVSLAAAGQDAGDWAGLRACVERFSAASGWVPGQVAHVAGAFRFTQYDFFRTWAMRWIASEKGVAVTAGADTEFTDWAALGALLDTWAAGVTPRRG
ncbi:flavodoxin domain-containing protein [Ruixingdingia sedimenti]|uniref:Flavodoxin domain-containing protein n=1 Tax=Ruixingdingia sedimenti TaxID=3073604 RepID=A0ABU1FAY2_9RHOB|nr:flavodoxin domain-containing protein [Xinfangfangia sp. LG-4]MDR5654041.1 flavodoxin domain-containing protein [Xinfangfangia sp. LG-4]